METSQEASDLLLALDDESPDDPVLDWQAVFGNAHPVEIEIGIGKGRFLIDQAQCRSQTNFVGIEWASKYLRLAHERSSRRGLQNIRLVRADAREFVEFFVPSASVQAFHIYFPDPWPKARHHKRRLINPAFLREVERTLERGGRLWLATDHEGYFEAVQEALATSVLLVEIEADWGEARTNYERKYEAQGKLIFRKVLQLEKS